MKRLPEYLRFLIATYLYGMLCFTLMRIAFYLFNHGAGSDIRVSTLLKAFAIGARFDTVISCYILSVPMLLAWVLFFVRPGKIIPWIRVYVIVCYAMAFMICAADIPFYMQFNSRLTWSVFNWTETPGMMLEVVFGSLTHWLLLTYFLALTAGLIWLTKYLQKSRVGMKISVLPGILTLLLACGLVFIGMRGRMAKKSPIRWGTAFFSSNFFANQMALSPVFTFIRTALDARRHTEPLAFMNNKTAMKEARRFFGLPDAPWMNVHREIRFSGNALRSNVIIVFMESMSASWMNHGGKNRNLTPVLDSLAGHAAFYFDRFFSSGIHTFNGLHSTLYGYPAIMQRNPFKGYTNMHMKTGLPVELAKQGYHNLFFMPHDAQFDNMGGYFAANGFHQIISEEDFEKSEIIGTFGVPDHILYEKVIERLDMEDTDTPFMAAVVSCSNHIPLILPDDIPFTPRGETLREQLVSYSDWAIGHFLKEASRKIWYAHTIFVFLADHGMPVEPAYDMPLSYHHIPLIMLLPHAAPHSTIHGFGGQIDVFPTLMGILKSDYVNKSFGIDLLKEQRTWMYFSADNKLACINDSLYFIERTDAGSNSLYRYLAGDNRDIIEQHQSIADSMRYAAESMLQAAGFLLSKSDAN